MKKGRYPHIKNSFKNRFMTFFHAIHTNFGTKKKVDFINEENFKKVKSGGENLTVLLHGRFANYHRSMYSTIKLLNRYGINPVSIGYDFNEPIERSSKDVKKQIDNLMRKSKVDKINVIGICLGGSVARYFVEELGGKKIVNKLVTIGSPIHPVNEESIVGYLIDTFIGGDSMIYNSALEKIKHSHSIKDHFYIYAENDKIIEPKIAIHDKANMLPIEGGHLFISYNPKALEIAARYIQGKEILEDKL